MKNTKIGLMKKRRAGAAFTLIELLVVIAIIAILAGLIANLIGPAAKKKKINRVKTELAQLVTVIEAYKEKKGFYPPSNGNTNNVMTNQLFYELTGTIFNPANNNYQTINGSETIGVATIQNFFGTDGFANSSVDRGEIKNYFPGLRSTQYREVSSNPDVELLTVPVEGPNDIDVNGVKLNPWRYNSSTPTHNPGSYDLWAEIVIGGKTNIIGNWTE